MKTPSRRSPPSRNSVAVAGDRNRQKGGSGAKAVVRTKASREAKRAKPAPKEKVVTLKDVTPPKPPAVVTNSEARNSLATYVDSVVFHNRPMNIRYRSSIVATLAPAGAIPDGAIKRAFSIDGFKRFPRAMLGVYAEGPYALTRRGEVIAVLYAPKRDDAIPEIQDEGMAQSLTDLLSLTTAVVKKSDAIREAVKKIVELKETTIESTRRHIFLLKSTSKEGAERAMVLEAELEDLIKQSALGMLPKE